MRVKYLSMCLKANDVSATFEQTATAQYLEVKQRLTALPIQLDENSEMIFSNHVMALICRIHEQQVVEAIDEAMMQEISPQAWAYAHTLVDDLFQKAAMAIDRSEVFLVGTHMEMALSL